MPFLYGMDTISALATLVGIGAMKALEKRDPAHALHGTT